MTKYFGSIEVSLVVRIAHIALLHLILDFVFHLVHVLEFVWLDCGEFGQCKIVHMSNLVYTQLLHCVVGLGDL